jgi:NAD+ synthase (glutamine-hydrolysing)
MPCKEQFQSVYAQGYLRCAASSHVVVPADPAANLSAALEVARQADERGAGLLVLPELGLTGYAIDDLLHQQTVLDAAERALDCFRAETKTLLPVCLVGVPLRWRGRLFNCVAVLHRGAILGVVPKTYLPNYREFYEARHFSSGSELPAYAEITLSGRTAPFGADLLFCAEDLPGFVLGVEVCEDVWVPIPPSSHAAMAGATVLANLSASNAVVGKTENRHALCQVQSMRCNAAYIYSAAGFGESTTDLAWDGQSMIFENGTLLAEAPRFSYRAETVFADVDIEQLLAERMRNGSFSRCAARNASLSGWRELGFTLKPPRGDIGFERHVARFPFVPDDLPRLDALCEEAFEIQSQGLARRLQSSGIEQLVIGVSGGLDSSHALLVAVHALERLGLPRTNILAYTLPAFATSKTTKSAAWRLMRALGVSAQEIDLSDAAMQMLRDIRHPAADGEPVYDTTYENVQAGARTALLFRLANRHRALVLGTGDLSELALGWCTYGVGDHMSHYNVNASVPKTLIQYLIRWVAARDLHGTETSQVLREILATEISPELVPGSGEAPAQLTEDFVGPYALQDFNLFHFSRYGLRPSKIAFLAWQAWRDASQGNWPPYFPEDKKHSYDLITIRKWLEVFIWRFFQTSQFKRSAQPNGPKISSGGSLSPRGDWRMPSDASAAVWLQELQENVPGG